MLSVGDNRSRNRSKSRERSRSRAETPPRAKSRDIRAPSPARRVSPPRSSKSSRAKKYYEPDSDSEVSESESEHDRRRTSTKSRGKETYEVKEKYESKHRRRRSETSESESESDSESEEEDARYKTRSSRSEKEPDRRSERDRRVGKHEYAEGPERTRHMSYSDRDREYKLPGSFEDHEVRELKTRHMSISEKKDKEYYDDRAAYQTTSSGGRPQYQVPAKYQYAQPSHEIQYVNKSGAVVSGRPHYVQTSEAQIEVETRKPSRYEKEDVRAKTSRRESEEDRRKFEKHKSSRRESDVDERKLSRAHRADPQLVEIHPGGLSGGHSLDPRSHRLSVSGGGSGALTLAAPGGHRILAGALPPGSPLLEAYRGTYQSISPMPSPMALPAGMDSDLSDLELLEPEYSSDDEGRRRPKRSILKKRVEIDLYDPEPDALLIAADLKAAKPGSRSLVKVLPHLSDENLMALRVEYKKHFKVGNGKGINIAKHIKLKVTGNIGKIAYATALGRWESEAHWANFWYQSGSSRRELLIESLIGRSNIEIRKIKEAFSDKRYNDSLEKCMQTELKKDKFRNAVLLALEEKRQDELSPLSKTLIAEDVRELYKSLVSKDGGETAMINIIIVRSDMHIRQVLVEFEAKYKRNFAREMIQKSQNLVGETLAHVLNGVLNRPVRDALLLHQALAETSKDRTELLVSRLVRYHWDPRHMERIKVEYKRKYGHKLERDIEESTKGDYGEFCLALCEGIRIDSRSGRTERLEREHGRLMILER